MEGEKSPQRPKPKFSVYQNPAFSAALTAKSAQPSRANLCLIFCISMASAFALLAITSREKRLTIILGRITASDTTAKLVMKILQFVVGLIFMATLSFLIRALSLRDVMNSFGGARASMTTPSKKMKERQPVLTDRQLWLLGLKPKPSESLESFKKPPKSRPVSFASEPLVPIRKSTHSHTPTRPSQIIGSDQQSSSGGRKMAISPVTPSAQYSASPLTPWSKQSSSGGKGILTEEMLEQFLADVDEKITESATKTETPRATICGFGMASPSSVSNSSTSLGTSRSTPLRPVRMSPGSHQKFSTPPKKGEGEFPPPMSMEQTIETFESLGIYLHIEQWRDRLRQWFCSVLLNPLIEKIETSHIQVMQAAASLGISITINQVGSDLLTASAPISVSPIDRAKEWQPTFTLDEDGILHQLRASLVQACNGSVSQLAGLQPQKNLAVPVIQACVDAITEHQRLHALMKGELVKGLLPQSSVRADYTVQRVRELAEGTCVKSYEYVGTGEVYDKTNKKWTLELPTDSHLLSYLFCAFLDHPKWMLHVDPTSYSGTQSGKNPLFLGILPPKERFPEKYVAVISGVPSIIHPGASILVIGKQSPPIFTLYWDKKLQFSLQGRTAMWDALLLLCYRIKEAYGGVVRGVHLDSSAFNILPVLDSETEG